MRLRIFCISLMLAAFISITAHGDERLIDVRVDDATILFEETYGQPFIDSNNRTQVPVRAVMEAYGAVVEWDDMARHVIIKYEGQLVEIPLGKAHIYINGRSQVIDTSAMIKEGRTYLPIRAVVEALGGNVGWDASTSSVLLTHDADGLAQVDGMGDTFYQMGISIASVKELYGLPDDILSSVYGFEWWVYRNDYNDYYQVGVYEHKVVAFYRTTASAVWPYEVNVAMSLDAIDQLGMLADNLDQFIEIYDGYRSYITVYETSVRHMIYVDLIEGEEVDSLITVDEDYWYTHDRGDWSDSDFLRDQEKIIWELTNVFRVQHGLRPLVLDDTLSIVARDHSVDMYTNGYFSHDNLLGESPFDRMRSEGLAYRRAAENIAMGQVNGIKAVNDWINSEGHRQNMLIADLELLGVGISSGRYYTQDFMQVME